MHTKRMKCTMIMLGCLFTAFFLSACSNGRYTYELEGGEQTKVMQERSRSICEGVPGAGRRTGGCHS